MRPAEWRFMYSVLSGRKIMNSKAQLSLKGFDFDESEIRQNYMLQVRMSYGNSCNLACRFCAVDGYRNDKPCENHLGIAQRLNILNNIKQRFGTRSVFLNGRGELTLEPDLDQLIHGISDLGIIPIIATNGTKLFDNNSANWKLLYESGASIILKMNSWENKALEARMFGLNQESPEYKSIRRITESKEGREWLGRFANDNRVAMNAVICKDTAGPDGVPSVWRFCRDNNIVPWFTWLEIMGRATADMALPDEEKKTLVKDLQKIDEEYGYNPVVPPYFDLCYPPVKADEKFIQITNIGRIFLFEYTWDGNFTITNYGRIPMEELFGMLAAGGHKISDGIQKIQQKVF